jgi:hypothetical protein
MTFKKKKKNFCLGDVGKYIGTSQNLCRVFMVWLKSGQNILYV